MIDTHCHLLPAVDDGTRDNAEALELARELVNAGVRHVVCTSHFSSSGLGREALVELTQHGPGRVAGIPSLGA